MLLISTIACDVFAHDIMVMLCCVGACVVRVLSMCKCDRGWGAWPHPHDGRKCLLSLTHPHMLHVPSHMLHFPSRALHLSFTRAAFVPHACCISPSRTLHVLPHMLHFLPHACCICSLTHVAFLSLTHVFFGSRMLIFSPSRMLVLFFLHAWHTCLFFSFTLV